MSDILIGVSACLLGEQVRHDGGHKRNAFLLEELAPHVRFVPVCPEVGIGLGAPRESIRLVRRDDRIRLPGRRASITPMPCGAGPARSWASCASGTSRASCSRRARRAAASNASACGTKAPSDHRGRGGAYSPRRSSTPCPGWRSRRRAASLIRFHSAEKAAVLAHDVETAGRLGHLVAGQGRLGPQQLARSYRELHAAAFARPATPGRQANALMHLAGHLRGDLGSCDRQELREAIEDYRVGLVPVAVPLALLSRHLRAVGTEWARSQTYLRPYPGARP